MPEAISLLKICRKVGWLSRNGLNRQMTRVRCHKKPGKWLDVELGRTSCGVVMFG